MVGAKWEERKYFFRGVEMKQKKTFTRRSIMARFGVAAIGLSLMPKAMTKKKAVKRGACSVNTEEWVAKQEIAELRRMYGLATD